jgi:hypothetical protein
MDCPLFESYNYGLVKRKEAEKEEVDGTLNETGDQNVTGNKALGRRETAGMGILAFDEFDEEIEHFKRAEIYDKIIKVDRSDGVFSEWIGLVDRFAFLFTLFGDKNATITKEIRLDVRQRLREVDGVDKLGI